MYLCAGKCRLAGPVLLLITKTLKKERGRQRNAMACELFRSKVCARDCVRDVRVFLCNDTHTFHDFIMQLLCYYALCICALIIIMMTIIMNMNKQFQC